MGQRRRYGGRLIRSTLALMRALLRIRALRRRFLMRLAMLDR
jgi:hypothetical protein